MPVGGINGDRTLQDEVQKLKSTHSFYTLREVHNTLPGTIKIKNYLEKRFGQLV